jgi:hypothetical protein
MSSEHRRIWNALKDCYAQQLNKGSLIPEVLFTPHDYTHHCCNIYYILSNFLLSENSYSIIEEVELFVLNAAVLFHDISMSKAGCSRDKHATESVEYLRKERENGRCRNLVELDVDTFECICSLILAHSDDKTFGNCTEKHIESLPEDSPPDQRLKILAGILRLADELDVSSRRLDRGRFADFREALSSTLVLDRPDIEILQESLKHWDRCNYIRKIIWNVTYINQIDIETNANDLCRITCEPHEVIGPLVEMYEKINAEISYLNGLIFFKQKFAKYNIVNRCDRINIVGLDACCGLPSFDGTPYGLLRGIITQKNKCFLPLGPFDVEDLVELEKTIEVDEIWVIDRDFSTDMDTQRQNNYCGVLSNNLTRGIRYKYFVPFSIYQEQAESTAKHFKSELFESFPLPDGYPIPGRGCTIFNPAKNRTTGRIGIKDANVEGQFKKPGLLMIESELVKHVSSMEKIISDRREQRNATY